MEPQQRRAEEILGDRGQTGVQALSTVQDPELVFPPSLFSLPLTYIFTSDLSSTNMDEKETGSRGSDKDFNNYTTSTSAVGGQFYDPSKEHWTTRAGLSLESYKRAPGTTG